MNKWLLLIVLVSYPFLGQAKTIYKWVDDEGVTHFGDLPESRQSAPVNVQIPLPDPPASPVQPEHKPINQSKVVQKQPAIVMYGAAWCGVCKRARQYFSDNNIQYTEYDVDSSTKGKEDYKKMNGTGVPIFLIDGQRFNGFSASRFDSLIKK